MTESILGRLDPHRNIEAVDDAARLLEFLLGRFNATVDRDGESLPEDETTWRFRTDYPWQHARGADPETAIRNAMKEARTGRRELRRMKQAIKQEAVKREPTALKGLVR